MPPTVIFGDIRNLDLDEIRPILDRYGIKRLDSAAMYEKTSGSETRLGESGWSKDFVVDTKVDIGGIYSGALEPKKIDDSARKSLERLRLEKVNVLYCHCADLTTPLEEQARGFDEVYKKGWFTALGLSNLMPDMVERWIRIAETEGYIQPTWFQGQYNLVCRMYEDILFPLLRCEGIHFAAYSPLAGGFLNGNLRSNTTPTSDRFAEQSNHPGRSMYLERELCHQPLCGLHKTTSLCPDVSQTDFDRPAWYKTYDRLEEISAKTGLRTDELSLRWLMHHSQLRDGDVIILGASKAFQVEESLGNLSKGPLSKEVVEALDALWTDELRAKGAALVDPESWKFVGGGKKNENDNKPVDVEKGTVSENEKVVKRSWWDFVKRILPCKRVKKK